MEIYIKRNVKRHELWDLFINGELYCTTDSYTEAAQEYQEYMKERCANEVKSAQQKLQRNRTL